MKEHDQSPIPAGHRPRETTDRSIGRVRSVGGPSMDGSGDGVSLLTRINEMIDAISNPSIREKTRKVLAGPIEELKARGANASSDFVSNLRPVFAMGRSQEQVAQILEVLLHFITEVGHPSLGSFADAIAEMGRPTEARTGDAKQIVKPVPISGFLEFTPEYQLHLDGALASIRALFSAHGFVPIDTPAVERIEVLAAKGGDVDKEIYSLSRARGADDDASDADVALRYDLTVPLARYVARHFNDLTFPFKRFHIGDCWRGERPQDGRYRQFKQADIDVVNVERVPISFDADIPLIVNDALQRLGISDYVFRISNRKILAGYLSGIGVEDVQLAARALDKLEKVGSDAVAELLTAGAGLSATTAARAIALAEIKTVDTGFRERVAALGVTHPILEEGLCELEYVMTRVCAAKSANFLADLSITRGFDYYTGTVYEVLWQAHPNIGSIAAGGRYDDLASNFIRRKLPGVGMSIGISRVYGKLVQTRKVKLKRSTATDVLVVWDPATEEQPLQDIARNLRARDVNVEVYFAPDAIGEQLRYANKKGIKYVVFPRSSAFRDMTTGSQFPFDMESFAARLSQERTQ